MAENLTQNQIITIAGRKKMLRARAGEIQLPKIVGFVFGDGGVDADGNVIAPLEAESELKNELLRKKYDTYTMLSDTKCKYEFDPSRGKLKSWLSIIARTKAIDRCREIAKTRTISLESTILVSDLGIVDDMIQEETRRVLIAAVNALGEPDREILVRRYYYEQKPKEIALALNLSVKQVNNRLYQTKQKLREALSN